MPELGSVTVDRRALTALNALPSPDQARVLELLTALANQPPDQWPQEQVRRLATPEPLYVLQATGELLVIFHRAEEGRITVLDLVLREMIERYFAKRPETQSRS
jgi:hypothetical protein